MSFQTQFADLVAIDDPTLQQLRQQAWEYFSQSGFPKPQLEHWKYTNLRALEKQSFVIAQEQCMGLVPDDLEPYLMANTYTLVFVNGQFDPALSKLDDLPKTATMTNLASVIKTDPQRLRPHFAKYADMSKAEYSLTALNTAFMTDGAYIELNQEAKLTKPIHLLFVTTPQQQSISTQPRILIIVNPNAKAKVIEQYVSLGASTYFTNVLSEISLAANSQLEHYKIQQESDKAYHIATMQVQQQQGSRLTDYRFAFGALLARDTINSILAGEYAESDCSGLYLGQKRQHIDYHVCTEHQQAHCRSTQNYKGVLMDRARGVFNGRVHVHPNAKKTDSQQSNKNLLLSKDAEIDTKPELEIYADEVQCSHGATVGQLDDNMVFYLRSRGLSQQVARHLLTYGFAKEIIEGIDLEALQMMLGKTIAEKLPGTEQLKEEMEWEY